MSAAERLLALARWRWTPLLGLASGTATLVFTMATVVPDRFGSVLAPPPRRTPLPMTNTAPADEAAATPTEDGGPQASSPRATTAPTRGARAERRRGFSPVIRADEPPAPSRPPETEDEAVAQVEQVQRTEEEQRRWEEGQAAAARAATRAARHASAVAGRPFGSNRRSLAEVPPRAGPDVQGPDVQEGGPDNEAAEQTPDTAPNPAPEGSGQDGDASADAPDQDAE